MMPTARSPSTAASTTRSRFAASASNSARSRPSSPTCPASTRRRWCCAMTTASTSSSPSSSRKRARRSIRKAMRAELRANLPAYMVPGALRDARRAAAPVLRQGQPQRPEKGDADRAPSPPRSRRSRRPPTEAILLDAAKKVLPPQSDAFRCRFLHRSRRPFAAGGAFRLARPPDAVARRHHPAGHVFRADAARHLRAAGRKSGTERRPEGPVLHAAAAAASLPLRPRAGRLPAFPAGDHDRAMAGDFRLLHAADRHGRQHLAGNRLAARRLCHRQHRHGDSRHSNEMAGDRQVQAGPLSHLGRLLFPRVAGPAHAQPHPHQVASGVADHGRLSARARRKGRRGRQYIRSGDRRGRPHLDRRGNHPRRRASNSPTCPSKAPR